MRDHLKSVRRIVIDELHSLAPNKRGVDLMLSIERLSDLVSSNCGHDPQRIGLSATIAPLDRMAGYLVGSHHAGRDCAIADASFDRPLELDIVSVFGAAGKTPFATTAAINKHVYDVLEKAIRGHRTTLVFTNLRSATERVTFALRKRFAANPNLPSQASSLKAHDFILPHQVEAHHSSLDRDVRLDIERRLKAGELRCVVCSTSLELGIDIGSIDRVILLNSPKGVARGLQRIGRSGHSLNGVARGTFVPTVPGDLIEALVTADAMRKKVIHPIDYPKCPLDILAQHLIGMALQNIPYGIDTGRAFDIARRTLPFADLTEEQFRQTLQYIATPELHDTARVAAKLWLEERGGGRPLGCDGNGADGADFARGEDRLKVVLCAGGVLHPLRRSTLALYAQNVGTITQEGQVKVKIQNGAVIGSIEEAFAQLLKPGDRFLLGGRCVQFVSAKGMTAEVTESTGQSPTVPRWFSGAMSMEAGLASRMRDFRAKVRAIA
jgi:ATP-dependent Lhr-like helicase